jgi:hypothetical protein
MGAASGTPEGDRLDILTTPIDAFEREHHPTVEMLIRLSREDVA